MNGYIITATAGADLSASENLVVYFDGSDSEKVKVQTSDTATTTAGVLVVGNGDDKTVQVCVFGPCLAKFGGVVEKGDPVMVNGSGELVTADGTNDKVIIGRYFGAGDTADGDIREVFIDCIKTYVLTPAA